MILLEQLGAIYWEERWLTLEARGEVELPAYAGSTMRGALGAVMRPALCAEGGRCGEQCGRPEMCPFYSLFEQSRAAQGKGTNIPKPLIVEAPLGEELREIAVGGTVEAPYALRARRVAGVPVLVNKARMRLAAGARIRLGLRGLGPAGAALDGVVEGVRQKGLEVNGGRLTLVGVDGGRNDLAAILRHTADSNPKRRRVRIALATPTLIKAGDAVCVDPARLGELVLEQAVVRTVSLYNAFFATPESKIPFLNVHWPGVVMTSHRLFCYELPRHSYRQGRWMDFDGVVGWLEWEGDVGPLTPWLRAAEVLHVGQKATFGLGRVEVMGEC